MNHLQQLAKTACRQGAVGVHGGGGGGGGGGEGGGEHPIFRALSNLGRPPQVMPPPNNGQANL